ncbi:MAG: protein kinase [Chloroflexota bacterium]|nr:protein kinase [Chloroflexota bacterium]
MARVYLARDRFLTRQVAVKILHPALSGDKRFLARFRREAEAAAALNHPHVVGVYDVGNDEDLYYIIMEYVAGLDLKELLLQSGPLPPRRVADIGAQVAAALQYAHDRRMIHRDIRPHNVMVTHSGLVKVADFGIATLLSEITLPDDNLSLGTAQYAAPEQIEGGPTSARTDIYSLGVVLYEIVTGFVPFPGESALAVAQAQVHQAPVPPSTLHTDVTPDLEQIILRAMEKNPKDRFQTAAEMGRALQAVHETAGARAATADPAVVDKAPRPKARPVPRRERGSSCITRLIGLLTLAFIFGVPLLLWRIGDTGQLPGTAPFVATATPRPVVVTATPRPVPTPLPATPLPTAGPTSSPVPTATVPPRPTFGAAPTPTPTTAPTPPPRTEGAPIPSPVGTSGVSD